MSLQIVDIRYFDCGRWTKNEEYLSAFSLFSSLFKGHFINIRNGKKQREIENVSNNLINVYKQNHDFGSNDEHLTPIPIYIQQLFFKLLEGFQAENEHLVIRSE